MTKSVLVVGGGIVGLSTAYHLAERGHRVTVVDSGPKGGDGCSYGNAGMIVPSHFVPLAAPGMVALGLKWMWNPESPFYLKPRASPDLLAWVAQFWKAATAENVARVAPLLRDLHLASRAIFEDWSGSWKGGFGLTTRGLLMLCKTEHGLDEEIKAAVEAVKLGVPAQVLTPRQITDFEPKLTLDVAGAVHYPLDAHLTPLRLMNALRKQVEKAGVTLLTATTVTGFERKGRHLETVKTSSGDLGADEIVLAAGVFSTAVARGLGLKIPMEAGKGYSLTLTEPRVLPKLCAILTEARVAVTPMGKSLRVGGTMELSGLNDTIDSRRVAGIVKSFVRYFPDFTPDDFEDVTPWCGMRPCSPDGLPYLGRFARFDNLTAVTGHSMMGVSLGPISGKLAAQIVSNETPSIDISALNPDRYD